MIPHFIHTILLVAIFTQTSTDAKAESPINKNSRIYRNVLPVKYFSEPNKFVEYMKKYDPVTASEKVNKQMKEKNPNATKTEIFDMIFEKIDPSADLMKLKVQNGKAVSLDLSGRRQWTPPVGNALPFDDRYGLRPRFFELMKQAIYQTRNKMVVMQIMREKYRSNSLYKMGYLTAKTDTAVKTFTKVSRLAYEGCSIARALLWARLNLFETLVFVERLLSLWFQVDLLVDLIIENDVNLYKVLDTHNENRVEKWKFVD